MGSQNIIGWRNRLRNSSLGNQIKILLNGFSVFRENIPGMLYFDHFTIKFNGLKSIKIDIFLSVFGKKRNNIFIFENSLIFF